MAEIFPTKLPTGTRVTILDDKSYASAIKVRIDRGKFAGKGIRGPKLDSARGLIEAANKRATTEPPEPNENAASEGTHHR